MAVAVKLSEEDYIQQEFDDLLYHSIRSFSKSDHNEIIKAFKIAKDAHKDTKRKSGEPYILHPIAVAKIVTNEIGLGKRSIIAALLHDVVEDTEYTIEDIERNFDENTASIIDGLTKISGIFDSDSSPQAENFRKMLLTLVEDVRVIFIKLADRLHNMRTLSSLSRNKQIKIAGETIYLYAPLAHRLGLYSIKTELEDLSLKFRYPEAYEQIANNIKESEKTRTHFINRFALPIIEKLDRNNIKFDISGRPKSIYSIWNKIQTKHVEFEEIYDLFAIRIVFDAKSGIAEKTQCWNIYSMITDIYLPKPDRIRDWVSTPKANGYEALHATVMGPSGKWVEVQIRTRRMDEVAEKGYAAHWKYKQDAPGESELDKWLNRIKESLKEPHSNALEFLDDFKMNLFSSEIIIFTPKGHTKTLPKGATALDFAYEIHSEIGNKAIGAKIGHKLYPLNHVLSGGDQVEILTSDKQRTQKEWLDFVITLRAKAGIKSSLKAETKNRIDKGKTVLDKRLKEFNLRPSSRIIRKLLSAYSVVSKDELYSKIGSNLIDLKDLKKVLKRNTRSKIIRYWELQFGKSTKSKAVGSGRDGKTSDQPDIKESTIILREVTDNSEPEYIIANCCSPIPGDDVIGYKKPGKNIIIHKTKCPFAIQLMSKHGDDIVPAKWTTHKVMSFLTRISLRGIDKFGVYNNITTVISKDLNVNIRTINLESHDGIFEGTIDLYVHNVSDLNNLIMNLIKIRGMDKVYRVENFTV